MTYLLLSILALIAGPFIFSLAARRPAAREGLEGFILVTLAGIIFLHIAPEAWRIAGFASVATGLLGLAFPTLLEGVYRQALSRAHLVVLAVAAAGIVVHAVLDGIALLPLVTGEVTAEMAGEAPGSRALAIGVIIHRLPVGMAIWWVLRPQFGTGVAITTFVVVIVTTVIGYFAGGEVFESNAWSLALFQAFVAGSLIHVALFGATHEHDHEHLGEGHEPSAATAATVAAEDSGAPEAAVRPRSRGFQARGLQSLDFRSRAYRAGLLLGLLAIFILPHISS